MYSKWPLSLTSSHQNIVRTSPISHTCHMFRPSHSFRFDHLKYIWRGVQIMKLFTSLFHCLGCTKGSVQVRGLVKCFVTSYVFRESGC
jgi:hypothetical protein